MIKVILVLGSIALLCTAAVISSDPNIVEGCESDNELWSSVDGTKFYFCLGDNMALEQPCDPNTFFVKNATVCGCIPIDEVDDNCIYHVEAPECTGVSATQPQPHMDPTKYYLCPAVGADPLVMDCEANKAFVNQDGYLGCVNWPMWRQVRNCN